MPHLLLLQTTKGLVEEGAYTEQSSPELPTSLSEAVISFMPELKKGPNIS